MENWKPKYVKSMVEKWKQKYVMMEEKRHLLENGICPLCETPDMRHEQIFHVEYLICDNCNQEFRVMSKAPTNE